MHSIRFQLIPLVLALALFTAAADATELVIPAGDFDWAQYSGQVVVLDFWAGWCKPCKQVLPWLSELQEKYGEQGLVVIAVNVDRPEAVPHETIAGLHKDIVVVLDPKRDFSRPYRLEALPTAILLDRQGRIRARDKGFNSEELHRRERDIVKLLKEEWLPDPDSP